MSGCKKIGCQAEAINRASTKITKIDKTNPVKLLIFITLPIR
ncbi:hypothetical protein XMD420_000141 [Marinobacterium sp. xm-d-420]|nr:hypothetical protein [Marinobacterium sp. xm-d-420]